MTIRSILKTTGGYFLGHKRPSQQEKKIAGQAQSAGRQSPNNASPSSAASSVPLTGRVVYSEVDSAYAWFILACVFILNTTTLGALKVHGLIFERIVRLNYYTREDASWPIATASTIQNFAGLLTPTLTELISWRMIELMQTSMFVVSNLGAYFSTSLYIDILGLGILQGVALSLRYNMNIAINNEYFDQYRTTAMGISMAGATCGAFFLSPLVSYALDVDKHQFRLAYLALAIIMAINYIFNLFIRRPRLAETVTSDGAKCKSERAMCTDDDELSFCQNCTEGDTGTAPTQPVSKGWRDVMLIIGRNPFFHCIWILQTIYFYISRTYTIILVDLANDMGFETDQSRSLLNYWVYGELLGRLLLGPLVDSRLLSIKYCTIVTCMMTAISSYLLISPWLHQQYFWYCCVTMALAGFSSLIAMLIVPFAQTYLPHRSLVPWAYAMGAFISSLFLLVRPVVIGLSRDTYHSYNLLIMIMATVPLSFALLLFVLEPILMRLLSRCPGASIQDSPCGP